VKTTVAETYEETKKIIYTICHRYKKSYGGDLEEYISLGNYGFMVAYDTYDPKKTKFTTWLYHVVDKTIHTAVIKEQNSKRQLKMYQQKNNTVTTKGKNDLLDLVFDLSNDARHIITILFDCPPLLKELLIENRCTIKRTMATIKRYLKTRGWDDNRINQGIWEITGAIKK
jgi:RNA polymerase sigma factor (sigma-70 family)